MNRFSTLFLWASLALPAFAGSKALTFEDIMGFESIQDPVISSDGLWVAFEVRPDRGDGRAEIRSLESETTYRIERGSKPSISRDSRWVGVRLEPPFEGERKTDQARKTRRRPGMVLIETRTGETYPFEGVEEFRFSRDSRWLFYWKCKEEEADDNTQEGETERAEKKEDELGRTLVIRNLDAGADLEIPSVKAFDVHPVSEGFVYCVEAPDGEGNGIYWRSLADAVGAARELVKEDRLRCSSVKWDEAGQWVAFLAGASDATPSPGREKALPSEEEVESARESREGDADSTGVAGLYLWDRAEIREVRLPARISPGWVIPRKNTLRWTKDGQRLFFGLKPAEEMAWARLKGRDPDDSQASSDEDLFDLEKIVGERELDLWHWSDSRIQPQQKKLWPELRDRTFAAVYHLRADQVVLLADPELPRVDDSESPTAVVGFNDVPYLKEISWDEDFFDIVHVNLESGRRTLVEKRVPTRGSASLSPDGQHVVYYVQGDWHLFDVEAGTRRNLTEGLSNPFSNEDHDFPGSIPGYGTAGWVRDSSAVLVYDKFDIWEFFTDGRMPLCLTGQEGRRERTQYRLVWTDPKKDFLEPGETLLLSGYRDPAKNFGFFSVVEGRGSSLQVLLEEKKRFRFVARAEDADVLLYTRESYDEFPDLWVADGRFSRSRKITSFHSKIEDFAWGRAELVEWNSLDGKALQGVLIKPGNYVPGKRYPVIVYFYRFFSQRLHEFNQPVVNHRPCFPLYASNGYAIFLPDIRFEVGRPGPAAVKSLVPGVQKLVDMGVADPKALGLHGHSWSGYQTAFIITQTDLFTAAVAGAPVSNMTSAYGGIRLGSGRARQFQYEKAQSRIGGSLWEYPERYIANSPLFFADRIRTPLLIQFGDEDDAVPWQQGVELYLAMRRLGKDCILLQYRGEPHHLKKYPNKLDYAIKMKEYFDHYLKGAPAPAWITRGEPYRGR